MVLSASRRTDIPALYGEWLINRLRAGEALAPDPYRAGRASRIRFSPDAVDCIVFWTKNAIPFEKFLPEIEALGYRDYYFTYTVTAFGPEWEPGLPPLEERLEAFQGLSAKLGPERVDWRFDPIVLDPYHSPQWYAWNFEALCEKLSAYTRRCILSFVDHYAHLGKAFPDAPFEDVERTAALLSSVAAKYNLPLYACAEAADLSAYGIRRASCIDREKVERITGGIIKAKRDPGQRSACGCVESVDIGSYNTCVNGCAYCYATKSKAAAQRNFQVHDPKSPMLMGWPADTLEIREKSPLSLKSEQITFF